MQTTSTQAETQAESMTDTALQTAPTRRYRIREGLHCVRVDDEAVVYDLVQDSVHYLNATARFIWDACRDGRCAESIIAMMQRENALIVDPEVTPETILNDVERTLATLSGQGLIVVE